MPPDFIDLDRSFVPVAEGEEPHLELNSDQGRRFGGWLDWGSLLTHPRVVLLAEAGCGKTAEFRHRAQALRDEGHAAFFARIEDLEDGVARALDIGTPAGFAAWKEGDGPGFLFLDSVDEARLSRKRFDKALRCLARDIGENALPRARILLSCRVSDWRGDEDRATFQRLLPPPSRATALPLPPPAWNGKRPVPAWKAALLAPFDEEHQRQRREARKQQGEEAQKPPDQLIVQLAPLDSGQQRAFILRCGVVDPDTFMDCLHRKQLEALAERPGDLRSLVDYWKQNGTLHHLHAMSEWAVQLRLREGNPDRRGNDTLSEQTAREGAERLAAGLMLGRCFTLRAPDGLGGEAPDDTSLDAADLLPDWTDADRAALMLRGLFAPAVYGRVRFYHRWAQEYLTACWLRRMLRTPGNRAAVHGLLFAERYGVETSVPSLRPVAAWLSLWDADVRAGLIRRTPFALIRHGDPTALSMADRAELLRVAARLHAEGRIADDGIDVRDLALFADPALAPVIREAWDAAPRRRFRFILLRLIREAGIRDCADIAQAVALDEAADPHNRTVAMEALSACDDKAGIEEVVSTLMAGPAALPARVASAMAQCFFPKYMSTEQLLRLIDEVPLSEGPTGGLDYMLPDLFNACPDLAARLRLAEGIAELCLAPPLIDGYHRVSSKHFHLAQRLTPVVRNLVRELRGEPHPALSALLSVIRRSRQQDTIYDEKPAVTVASVLSDYPSLKQALFWEAAAEEADEAGPGNEPTRVFRIEQPFEIGRRDLPYFQDAVSSRPHEWEKRLALHAVIFILETEGALGSEASSLRTLIEGFPALENDLAGYLTPRPPGQGDRARAGRRYKRNKEGTHQRGRSNASWVGFQRTLSADPQKLRDPSAITDSGQSASDLWNLTKWLKLHSQKAEEDAVLAWPALAAAFGQTVADAYRDGMGALWRCTSPETASGDTRDAVTRLSYSAIGIEAKDNPEWASRLSTAEVERAAGHACLFERGCPFWFDALLAAHPAIVTPFLAVAIRQEMQSTAQYGKHFLGHYARMNRQPPPVVSGTVLECLKGATPGSLGAFDHALEILNAPAFPPVNSEDLYTATLARLEGCGQDQEALRHLALLFTLDSSGTLPFIAGWIGAPAPAAADRASLLFSELFDLHHRDIATASLSGLSTACLEALLRLVYQYVQPGADKVHEGVFTPDTRDKAESARNNILRALLSRTGPEVRAALLRVADTLAPANRVRFAELAHEMAERGSDPPPWAPSAVIKFENEALLPARNGDELLNIVAGILEEIGQGLARNDASSRLALCACPDEDAVQGWLVEQLNLRAQGRYTATQETITCRRDRMDVLVQAVGVPDQLAIEIKHGGKQWTAQDLLAALEMQLGEGYLLPAVRRHGILVVTHHGRSHWQHPVIGSRLPFSGLMELLRDRADTLTKGQHHSRILHAVGLDAAPDDPGAASRRGGVRPPARSPGVGRPGAGVGSAS